jgi:membrane-bound lytic murein transglycosylase A
MKRLLNRAIYTAIVGILAACSSGPSPRTSGADVAAQGPALQQARSRWTPVSWRELPGVQEDSLQDAWKAWLRSCERPGPAFIFMCDEVRALAQAGAQEQRNWMMSRLQPYRIEPLNGGEQALLTAYYEPVLEASRMPTGDFSVPVFQPPATLYQRKPWYSREEIDTRADVRAQLRGREIAYLAHPTDALTLQIQGSGRLLISEPNGVQRMVRLSYAGSNDQPYRSVGRWLINQGELRDGSWPAIKSWVSRNPGRVNELMWSNPRVVFFREEMLSDDPSVGPRGAQGVPLTAGRSIAVDPLSIPYGTPVWMASSGAQTQLNKLVIAQDTGSAIVGAVRADYFAGSGIAAGELAGRLKQPLQLWALWPRP